MVSEGKKRAAQLCYHCQQVTDHSAEFLNSISRSAYFPNQVALSPSSRPATTHQESRLSTASTDKSSKTSQRCPNPPQEIQPVSSEAAITHLLAHKLAGQAGGLEYSKEMSISISAWTQRRGWGEQTDDVVTAAQGTRWNTSTKRAGNC